MNLVQSNVTKKNLLDILLKFQFQKIQQPNIKVSELSKSIKLYIKDQIKLKLVTEEVVNFYSYISKIKMGKYDWLKELDIYHERVVFENEIFISANNIMKDVPKAILKHLDDDWSVLNVEYQNDIATLDIKEKNFIVLSKEAQDASFSFYGHQIASTSIPFAVEKLDDAKVVKKLFHKAFIDVTIKRKKSTTSGYLLQLDVNMSESQLNKVLSSLKFNMTIRNDLLKNEYEGEKYTLYSENVKLGQVGSISKIKDFMTNELSESLFTHNESELNIFGATTSIFGYSWKDDQGEIVGLDKVLSKSMLTIMQEIGVEKFS